MTGHDLDCSVSANFRDQRLGGQQIDHQIYLNISNIDCLAMNFNSNIFMKSPLSKGD